MGGDSGRGQWEGAGGAGSSAAHVSASLRSPGPSLCVQPAIGLTLAFALGRKPHQRHRHLLPRGSRALWVLGWQWLIWGLQ